MNESTPPIVVSSNGDMNFEDLVFHLERAYTKIMREDGKDNYTVSLKHRQVFQDAAKICAFIKADPYEYVQAQYDYYKKKEEKTGFFPTYLNAKFADDRYQQFKAIQFAQVHLTLDQEFNMQHEYLQRAIQYRPLKELLMDKMINFTPWFRICATIEPDPDVIERFGAYAKHQRHQALSDFLIAKGLDASRLDKL